MAMDGVQRAYRQSISRLYAAFILNACYRRGPTGD
jgi:hypothetical protein